MQDIKKKRKRTFQLTKKNTFSLKNCSPVKKTDRNFFLQDLKDNCSYLKKNLCFDYFQKVYLFTSNFG